MTKAASFKQQYQKAFALKPLEVEETIDVRWHRPLAAALTVVLSRFPVKPNHVTLMSLASGWAGSLFLFLAAFRPHLVGKSFWWVAAVLIFASVVFDCADGQLARMKGGGTRVGRILDGLVDALVLIPVYVILGFFIRSEFGTFWFTVAVIAGVSTWIHCIVYDKYKNLYLSYTHDSAGGGDGTETIEAVCDDLNQAKAQKSWLDATLLRLYIGYLQIQDRLASGSTEVKQSTLHAQAIKQYRRDNLFTMRIASWLGLGTHMFCIYLSIAIASWYVEILISLQVLFAVVFNAIMLVALLGGKKMRMTSP